MMKDSGIERGHSVILDENECKGCTICVTTCPTEAIRVRDGKAFILDERCIDCGECIRRCPNHAKKAKTDDVSCLTNPDFRSRFLHTIAIPAPSLYGQFAERFGVDDIHRALIALGFDEVFPVAQATGEIAEATRSLLARGGHERLPRPIISSSCPTIVKFIQIRFPTLLSHIAPVIAPMEYAARIAKQRAEKNGKQHCGVFFISPCAGKITEARTPIGNENSSVDGVFSMKDLYLPLFSALLRLEKAPAESTLKASEIAWGRAGGEAEATIEESDFTYLTVDGMAQCLKILEKVEDGKLEFIDFLELMACTEGCVGGPLVPTNPAIARFTVCQREKKASAIKVRPTSVRSTGQQKTSVTESCFRSEKFPAKPALLLDPDYQKALQMMATMEQIYEGLPGLDCGCCGAPNCHALAEDIVRQNANRTDCVIILKEQYRALLDNGVHET